MVQARIKEQKMALLKVRKKECNRGDSWRMNKDTRSTNQGKFPQGVTIPACSNIKLLEELGTWVTPSQEVQAIKVSTMGPDDAPIE
jgi:hypothetical protein